MGQPSPKQGDNDIIPNESGTPTPPSQQQPPPSLQWVSVGIGGRVSSVRTVRSHVSKSYHQRKKESRKADLQKLSQQRRVRLRPADLPPSQFSSKGQDSESGIGGEEASPDSANASTNQELVRRVTASISPITSVAYQTNCEILLFPALE